MKNLSLVINVVLAVAIIVLYTLHFTGETKAPVIIENGEVVSGTYTGEVAVAWINMDSLLSNYDMYFDVQKELEEQGRKMEADMTSRTRAFEREMIDFQDKVQKGLVTRSTAQQMQMDLQAKEQELYLFRDELRMRFAEEEQVRLRNIQHSITDFIKEFNKDKGFQVVLSSSFGGPVLYGHPSIEITKEVLHGLNNKYAQSRSAKR